MDRKKTKEAKIKPGRSFKGKDTKTQYPIKIRNRIIILANENHTKKEVEQMLKLENPITRSTWYRWKKLKGVISEADDGVNVYRKSIKRLQTENRKNLERQAVELFKTKSQGGAFGRRFMSLAFREVMTKEPFCNDADLLKLQFTDRFCHRIMQIYGF